MFKQVCLSVLTILLLSGCSSYSKLSEQPFMHKDPDVSRILYRAFIHAGSVEKYQNLESISYKKRTILYHADGTKESDVTQFHEYQMAAALSATIFWMKDGERHSIEYKEGAGHKYVNGEPIDGSSDSATQSFLSAHYVLFMPFKLADENIVLSYEGQDKLQSGVTVDVIKAIYNPDNHSNHSTDDTWWYYFDAETGAYEGSMVYHAPTYAFIENTVKDKELPLVMNNYRKSYRVDKDRNIEYLRGEFFYEDYQMTFKN